MCKQILMVKNTMLEAVAVNECEDSNRDARSKSCVVLKYGQEEPEVLPQVEYPPVSGLHAQRSRPRTTRTRSRAPLSAEKFQTWPCDRSSESNVLSAIARDASRLPVIKVDVPTVVKNTFLEVTTGNQDASVDLGEKSCPAALWFKLRSQASSSTQQLSEVNSDRTQEPSRDSGMASKRRSKKVLCRASPLSAEKFQSWPCNMCNEADMLSALARDASRFPIIEANVPTVVKNTFLELAVEVKDASEELGGKSCPPALWFKLRSEASSRGSWDDSGERLQESSRDSGMASKRRSRTAASLPEGCVTVMVRNIPKTFSQNDFYNKLVEAGFDGCFDFVHVPLESRGQLNRGSAFVNFVDAAAAAMFHGMFSGQRFSAAERELAVIPATTQGYDEAVKRFSKHAPKSGLRYGRPLFLGQQLPRDAALRRRV